MKYKAVIVTASEDAFGYAFDEGELARLAQDAPGKPVLLLFAEEITEVTGAGASKHEATVVFESGQDLTEFYCVPSFRDGRLDCFGLVPVPADGNLSRVEATNE